MIVSTSFRQLHEPVHLIAENSGHKFSNIAFDEGLAVALGGTTNITIDRIDEKTKEIINSLEYIKIQKILSLNYSEFMSKADIVYFEMGSFVNFMIKEYGIERYLSLVPCLISFVGEIGNLFQDIHLSKQDPL